jgi:hypothetical protein
MLTSQTRGRLCFSETARSLTALLSIVGACLAWPAAAQIAPDSPTTQWVHILYPGGAVPDPIGDQQTGTPESDIIGNLANPAFYMKFNDGGSSSPTNGWVGFRLRVAADESPPGFKGAAVVGLDANLDGRVDLFIGVNNQGSGNQIGLWNSGPGQNISPSTTTLVSPAGKSYDETAGVYNFGSVNGTIDPTATTFDLDAGGKTDQFLSFVVPFPDVVSQLAALGISGFTRNTPMRLIAATATQDNSLNEDLNGVSGGINSSSTWEQLGGLSLPYAPNGTQPIPEPSTGPLAMLGAALAMLYWWRRDPRD